ncbi:RidA family protein [Luteimonas aquatica]|uniref:RidA family protein n=1 Tax=Luteimonas aquatica TaxID=450364 RepID=UPI001F570905|nr:Rid family hydrolase [Luteimonas aquatica]
MSLRQTLPVALAGLLAGTAAAAEPPATPSAPERLRLPHLAAPAGPYANAVRHGDTVYLSGLTAFGTEAARGDTAAQTRAVLAQLHGALRDLGADWPAVVKVTIFLTDLKTLPAVRAALVEAYGASPPASSLVQVSGLFDPALKVEIEAVVVAPAQKP